MEFQAAGLSRSLLCAKRERFSCNDRALLARCARHIKSVFNLIVNIHVMVN